MLEVSRVVTHLPWYDPSLPLAAPTLWTPMRATKSSSSRKVSPFTLTQLSANHALESQVQFQSDFLDLFKLHRT